MRSGANRLALCVAVFVLAGCGGHSIAPVKGVVTFEDKPVKDAVISFGPIGEGAKEKEPGKGATGYTDENGIYQLSTYKPLDGALVGKHQVTVVLDDTNKARCKRKTELVLEVKPGSNQLDIKLEK